MTVTVCIPAYRAGAFISKTLRSVAEQTHTDLRVLVAVDPSEDDHPGGPDTTLDAIGPFLGDPRFHLISNPRRLGWAENVRASLERVETPYFAILPHDDCWHPQYVEILLGALQGDHESVVAYADILRVGDGLPERKAVILGDSRDRFSQVMNFLLEGADGMPWRGVTRSESLRRTGGFPTDRHLGYAVECEYAQALLMLGPAVRVPRALFYKRVHAPEASTASRDRVRLQTRQQLIAGLEVHVARMRALIDPLMQTEQAPIVELAFTAAMLGRWQLFLGNAFDPGRLAQAREALDRLKDWDFGSDRARVAARLFLLLSRHAAACDRPGEANRHAEAAHAANPDDREAALWLARRKLSAGRPSEALDLIDATELLLPNTEGAQSLRQQAYRAL